MKRIFGMITTSRSHEYTKHALMTFFQFTTFTDGDSFYLIDNNNDCPNEIYSPYSSVNLESNSSPKSFAENMNRLFDRALITNSDLILLNNDIIFSPGWLPALEVDRDCITSSVCNMQYQYSHPSLSLKLTMSLNDYVGKENIFLEIVKRHCASKRGYQLIHSFPFYCVRIPFSVHSIIGKLDDGYSIAGWEDVDYILRSYQAGFPLFFALDSFIIHFYGKSTWAGDSAPDEREKSYLQSKAPQYKFEEKWGKELTDLFGLQTAEAMENLRLKQEAATIKLFQDIINNR